MTPVEESETPNASSFFSRPATRAGRWSGWMALAMVVFMFAMIILQQYHERDGGTLYQVVRLILGAVFTTNGLGALVLSIRGLMNGERSGIVWAALAVGVFMAAVLVAELTGLME